VKRLRTHDDGKTLETILGVLRGDSDIDVPSGIGISQEARQSLSTKLNYEVKTCVLNARNFGVPQNRERIIIVGINKNKVSGKHKDIIKDVFRFPKATQKSTCLGKILESNIEKHTRAYTISSKMWRGHRERKKRNAANGKGFGYVLVNHNSPYANTISARYWKDGSEILIDQSDIGCSRPRTLTEREAANLQGFPKNFRVDAVSKKELYKQMGNSVAIPMIKAVCKKLIASLDELDLITLRAGAKDTLALRKAS
jgi:DNA (cytosine-5)-methyltransferase 1